MKRIRESADIRHNGCAVFDKSEVGGMIHGKRVLQTLQGI